MNLAGEEPQPPRTEREMLDLVHARYASAFNGASPRYVVAEHVGLDPAWPARRLDAVVQDTWRSTGFAVHGIEVKVFRSDLRRELADPSKAGAFCDCLDYFWLAVPDKTIAEGMALPNEWGVLACAGSGYLRQVRPARRLRMAVAGYAEREPLPRAVQVAMLRAARKTYERRGA